MVEKVDIKALALYLPQYHKTEENDAWWGEGYTDWVAVKKAKKLFPEHRQPRTPYKNNYYDLLEKDTMVWQAKLAKKYGISGFCMYHYWFKDGKRVLDKPAENLLLWKDIDINYCFYWANESWIRSWSNVKGGNVWNSQQEIRKENEPSVLLEQEYGDEKDWREHFDYVLPFLKDPRYIKIDNKPVFMIYRPDLMLECLEKMMNCWKEWAREEGLTGIYFITQIAESHPGKVPGDAHIIHEFKYSMRHDGKYDYWCDTLGETSVLSYDLMWNILLERKYESEKKVYLSGSVDYDTTPRQGEKSILYKNVSPKAFEFYLTQLIRKSRDMGSEFVFINAWNEWGEGMYLEPDTEFGYGMLKAVRNAIRKGNRQSNLLMKREKQVRRLKFAEELYNKRTLLLESNEKRNRREKKFLEYYTILDKWMTDRENGFKIQESILAMGYKQVAIYGIGKLGKQLQAELADSNIKVAYWIDKKQLGKVCDLEVCQPAGNMPDVDAVIVTVTDEFEVIRDDLLDKVPADIISLKDLFS